MLQQQSFLVESRGVRLAALLIMPADGVREVAAGTGEVDTGDIERDAYVMYTLQPVNVVRRMRPPLA